MKVTLNCTEDQIRLIQMALDLYMRIGIGQLDQILYHPTFERHLENVFRLDKVTEVGDRTPQGEILKIEDGKALIAGSVKDGMWNEEHEWKDLKDVVLSTSYEKLHDYQGEIMEILDEVKEKLYADDTRRLSYYFGWSIHNVKVDPSCRMAYDLLQVIRHEFWKRNPNRSNSTVDSSVHFTYDVDNSSNKIKCKLK